VATTSIGRIPSTRLRLVTLITGILIALAAAIMIIIGFFEMGRPPPEPLPSPASQPPLEPPPGSP